MTPPQRLPDHAREYVQAADNDIDDVVETLVFCMQADITDAERNKRIGLSINDLRVAQRRLSNAIQGNYD